MWSSLFSSSSDEESPVVTKGRCRVIDSSVKFYRLLVASCLQGRIPNNSYGVNQLARLLYHNSPLSAALVITHLCPGTTTGRYSITFNQEIVQALETGHDQWLQKMLDGVTAGAEVANSWLWPEVYDNPDLTTDERAAILKVRDSEVLAMLNMIQQQMVCYDPNGESPMLLPIDSTVTSESTGSAYQSCMKGVCARRQRQDSNLFSASLASPSDVVMVPMVGQEISSNTLGGRRLCVTQTRCYPLDTVLDILLGQLDHDLPAGTEFMLRRRYATELKVCGWTRTE